MWCIGLVAPRYVGSSWTRAQTRVPCIGRQILNHCASREAPSVGVFSFLVFNFIYFWLRCFTWAFSSCGERGLLFVAVRGLLIAVASLVAEHGL